MLPHLFFFFNRLYWSIIALQWCVNSLFLNGLIVFDDYTQLPGFSLSLTLFKVGNVALKPHSCTSLKLSSPYLSYLSTFTARCLG